MNTREIAFKIILQLPSLPLRGKEGKALIYNFAHIAFFKSDFPVMNTRFSCFCRNNNMFTFMNWLNIIVGALFFGFCLFWMWGNKDLFVLQNKGTIVKMRIIQAPRNCLGTHVQHSMKLSFKGQVFWKTIGSNDCGRYTVGDSIDMRYLPGSKDILYPHESVMFKYEGAGIFGIIGLAMMIYGFFKKPKNS
jgi:hypothetical protein